MDKVAEQGAFGLFEYGAIGIFSVVLIYGIYKLYQAGAQERAKYEERDNARETNLRATVAKAFDERHDDAVKIATRLSRIEVKLKIEGDDD